MLWGTMKVLVKHYISTVHLAFYLFPRKLTPGLPAVSPTLDSIKLPPVNHDKSKVILLGPSPGSNGSLAAVLDPREH